MRSGRVSMARPRRLVIASGTGSVSGSPPSTGSTGAVMPSPRSRRGHRTTASYPRAGFSRCQPFHDPAAAFLLIPAEPQPVGQPVLAALPELDPLGHHPVPAPDRRPRQPAVAGLLVEQPNPALELRAGGHDRRLHR